MTEQHKQYVDIIRGFIPQERVYTDDARCLAWGTDAGFYRLTPQVVVRAKDETEVSRLLVEASRLGLPVTFRAAGTSLSGQAISDSVLIVAGKHWENYSISPDASEITLEPGLIGRRVDEILAPFGRMFAPDPASKNSAMVGGIIMNNASGMNCGTHANSDKILRSMRVVLADGTILDTGDAASRTAFAASHPEILEEIESVRDEIRADAELTARINRKYSIKNVMGLNLRPFVAYDDPFEIIAHLMVGSEGTLGFMSRATVVTSPVMACSASAMLYFTAMDDACRAVLALREGPIYSAEMLDRKSLEAVHDTHGDGLTALLVETKADTPEELRRNIDKLMALLAPFRLAVEPRWEDTPEGYAPYWKMRSGVFPAVGGTRPLGTTALIEDVAFHLPDLPSATAELQQLLQDCGYDDACIYGHALEGNYHFVISQGFDKPEEIERYKRLMHEVERLVIDRYDGSLKAEHGTGRNMAPFVEREWGTKAWQLMRRIKNVFDPQGILNPGVIFNDDPECYIKHLKALPLTNPHVDRCIECGFCEVNCVSCGLTFSARQRIVVQREISRLTATGEDPERMERLKKQFRYLGNSTCAGDGLCSTSCPMGINTGEMIHDLREAARPKGSMGYRTGYFAARHLRAVEATLRPALSVASGLSWVMGAKATDAVGRGLHKIGFPLWTSALPGANYGACRPVADAHEPRKVVYFPSCINRTFGASRSGRSAADRPLTEVMAALCRKAGYEVIYPKNLKSLCCGMIWESKGMPDIANRMTAQLDEALWEASEQGRWPVLCDQSPCLHRMREHITRMHLYEPAEFIADHLAQYLDFSPKDETIAVHVTCSTRRMGLAEKIISLARRCATRVVVPAEVGCCGFAGDKGFTRPELNKYALRKLRPALEAEGATSGYSNSRTCEIGLTSNSGIPYKSIAYLVDEVTSSKSL